MKKVYCKNCKFYTDNHYTDEQECLHKSNIEIEDNHDERCYLQKEEPSSKNYDNKCKYYKRKWWYFWIKK